MRALIIPVETEKPIEEIQLPDNFNARMDRLREILEGYGERVTFPGRADVVAWVDGDGLNAGKLPNDRATKIIYPHGLGLLGTVLITGEGWAWNCDEEDLDIVALPDDITPEVFA